MEETGTPASSGSPYPYSGPEALRRPIADALRQVVDPEVAMSIVDVGLVYGVTVTDDLVLVAMTMTSAACPVADVVIGDVESELGRIVPPQMRIHVELVWEPAWTVDRMSQRGKAFMGW
jgi:metal-sulfur cluster biosynthetic enzyme